jgi:hypothetical protein
LRAPCAIDAQTVAPHTVRTVRGANAADRASAINATVSAMVADDGVTAVAIIPASYSLDPAYFAACLAVFDRHRDLGVVSCWQDDGAAGYVRPCPAFPYQWIANDAGLPAVMRAEAFTAAGGLRTELSSDDGHHDLINAILAGGWKAVTYPAAFVVSSDAYPARATNHTRTVLRQRLPAEYERDASFVTAFLAAPERERGLKLHDVMRLPLGTQASLAFDAVRHPGRALRWIQTHWRSAVR